MYPYLLHSGHLVLPTYGVLAAIGLILGLVLSLRTAVLAGIKPDALWDAGLFAVIAAFVCSRVLLVVGNLHSFLEYPVLLLEVPSLTAPGVLLTLMATGVWLRVKRVPLLAALDGWAPCAVLVWSFLALGHFADGTDPGMASRFGLREPGDSTALVPVALYAAGYGLVLCGALLVWLGRRRRAGDTAALGLGGAGVGQFLLSFLRQPDGSGVTAMLDPLQWVSVGMMVAAGVLLLVGEPVRREAAVQVSGSGV